MNVPPLALDIAVWWPEPTTFFFVNLVATLATSLLLLAMLWRSPTRLMRPAFLLAGLCHLLYQWSLTLLADPIKASLLKPWTMVAFIHAGIWCLLAWVLASRWLDPPLPPAADPVFRKVEVALPLVLAGALASVYLWRVPVACTALYSLVVDPHMTLLAREFGGKLIGSKLASYALGALFHVAVPVAVALTFRMAWTQVASRRWVLFAAWMLLGFASISLVMLTGTKGLLVPSMLMLVTTSLLWNQRLRVKFVAGAFAVGAMAVGLVSFELVKERKALAGSGYDFAACAVRVNACERSTVLVESLKQRKMSLGLPRPLVDDLSERLACACTPGADIAACPAVEPMVIAFSLDNSLLEGFPTSQYSPGARRGSDLGEAGAEVGRPEVEPMVIAFSLDNSLLEGFPTSQYSPGARRGSDLGEAGAEVGRIERALRKILLRGLTFVEAIVNRAMVVPLQVASWHYMFVETEGSPGAAGIPMAGRLGGNLVNMPEIVYRKYGFIYSSGDRTSTSTAPTGFMLFYPAYIGVPGLMLAVVLVLLYDIAAVWLMRRVRPALSAVAAGLVLVAAMNLAVSDFLTVMGSHGGLAALLMMAVFILVDRFMPPPPPEVQP